MSVSNKYWLGKTFSEEHRKKISRAHKGKNAGAKHKFWKGDSVGYNSLHRWVKARMPKPELCPRCNKRKAIDLANKNGIYRRELSLWNWLCRHCHMIEDGRVNNLKQFRKERI